MWSPNPTDVPGGGPAIRGTVLLTCLLALCLSDPVFSVAQERETDARALFDSVVTAHSYEIKFNGVSLSGSGAEWLVRMANQSQYFLIGERHATAEIPAISGALYAELADVGYEYAALEIGPLAAQKADTLLREGGVDALERFLTREPFRQAIAFLSWREEAQLVARIVAEGGTIWGLDQEFIYSMRWHLSRLADLARTAAEREAVASLRSRAEDDRFLLGRLNPATLEELRSTFSANPSERAHAIIDALMFSNSVYRPYIVERKFFSRAGARRENYMKRNLVSKLRDARSYGESGGKVFFKFGGFHSAPRVYTDGQITLGTFVEEWARGHGHDAFNLYIGCNGGRSLSTGGREHAPQPCAGMIAGDGGQNTTAVDSTRIFARLLSEHEGELWLLNVRPLRDQLGQWDFLTADEKRWIAGFDAFLLVPDATPATGIGD